MYKRALFSLSPITLILDSVPDFLTKILPLPSINLSAFFIIFFISGLLIIFLSEFNYEINNEVIFEGFEGEEKEKEEEKDSVIDQMTIREQIKPKSASSQIIINKDDNNNN